MQLFLYLHISLCTVISANPVNTSSPILLWIYVFSLFRIEKLLPTEAVVAGNTIQVKFINILGGAPPTCAPLLPTPLWYAVRHHVLVDPTQWDG